MFYLNEDFYFNFVFVFVFMFRLQWIDSLARLFKLLWKENIARTNEIDLINFSFGQTYLKTNEWDEWIQTKKIFWWVQSKKKHIQKNVNYIN